MWWQLNSQNVTVLREGPPLSENIKDAATSFPWLSLQFFLFCTFPYPHFNIGHHIWIEWTGVDEQPLQASTSWDQNLTLTQLLHCHLLCFSDYAVHAVKSTNHACSKSTFTCCILRLNWWLECPEGSAKEVLVLVQEVHSPLAPPQVQLQLPVHQ